MLPQYRPIDRDLIAAVVHPPMFLQGRGISCDKPALLALVQWYLNVELLSLLDHFAAVGPPDVVIQFGRGPSGKFAETTFSVRGPIAGVFESNANHLGGGRKSFRQ